VHVTLPDDIDDELVIITTKRRPKRPAVAKPIAEATDWAKECEATRERLGVPQTTSAYEAALEMYWEAYNRFLGTPAQTLTGMAFKTSAILYFDYEAQYSWKGSVGDRQNLEQQQEILLELRKDLLRFAGLPDDFALEFAEGNEQYFVKPDSDEKEV